MILMNDMSPYCDIYTPQNCPNRIMSLFDTLQFIQSAVNQFALIDVTSSKCLDICLSITTGPLLNVSTSNKVFLPQFCTGTLYRLLFIAFIAASKML